MFLVLLKKRGALKAGPPRCAPRGCGYCAGGVPTPLGRE